MKVSRGDRVQLSEAGIKSRGERYRGWTGTSMCSCEDYTIRWDQSGGDSNHAGWELEPESKPESKKEEKAGNAGKVRSFQAGVEEFRKRITG